MTPPNPLPGFTPKKFFQKPENRVAIVPLIGLGVLLFWFWGTISDFVVNAADNLLHLMIVGFAITAIGWLLFDSSFRRFIWYLYAGVMRWITSRFVAIDQISVLKTYLEKMKAKKEEFQTAVDDLNGQKVQTEQQVKKDLAEYNRSCATYEAANKQNNERVAKLEANQMARLKEMLDQEYGDMQKSITILVVLSRYRDVCDDTITDWTREIQFRERQQKQARSVNRAMRAALGILKGMPADDEMRDMALDQLEAEYAQKMGEVEQALDLTKSVIESANVKDAASQEQAAKLFDQWKASNGNVDFGGVTKQQLIAGAEEQAVLSISPGIPTPVITQSSKEKGRS